MPYHQINYCAVDVRATLTEWRGYFDAYVRHNDLNVHVRVQMCLAEQWLHLATNDSNNSLAVSTQPDRMKHIVLRLMLLFVYAENRDSVSAFILI